MKSNSKREPQKTGTDVPTYFPTFPLCVRDSVVSASYPDFHQHRPSPSSCPTPLHWSLPQCTGGLVPCRSLPGTPDKGWAATHRGAELVFGQCITHTVSQTPLLSNPTHPWLDKFMSFPEHLSLGHDQVWLRLSSAQKWRVLLGPFPTLLFLFQNLIKMKVVSVHRALASAVGSFPRLW